MQENDREREKEREEKDIRSECKLYRVTNLTSRGKISLTMKFKLAHCPIYQKATDKLNIDIERQIE